MPQRVPILSQLGCYLVARRTANKFYDGEQAIPCISQLGGVEIMRISLQVGGNPADTMENQMSDEWLQAFDERPVLEALREWASKHPRKDKVFFAELEGERLALTPVEYYDHVRAHTHFGLSVLRFLYQEARRYETKPEIFRIG